MTDFRLKIWIFAAIFLRLALMPVTLHGDLLFTNYFPYFLSARGVWDIYGYFGDHYLLRSGYSYYAPMVYYTVGFFQTALNAVWPAFEFNAFFSRVHELFYPSAANVITDYFSASTDSQMRSLVFRMKLPYLLTEMGLVFLLTRLPLRDAVKKRLIVLWVFNPVIIFSIYVFGSYRIYTMLALWSTLFFLMRGRFVAAGLAYGVLLLLDNFPWFLLLPAALIWAPNGNVRFKTLSAVFGVFLIVFLPLYVSSGGDVVYAYVSPIFKKAISQSLTLTLAPREITWAAKSLFLALYAWMILRLFGARKRIQALPDEGRVRLFVWVGAWVLLLFYATNQTLIQYFTWVLPFFVWIQAEREPWSGPLPWFLMAALFFFNLDSRALNAGLFLPVDRQAMALPSFHEIMNAYIPYGKLVALSRWFFSFSCVVLSLRLYRAKIAPTLSA